MGQVISLAERRRSASPATGGRAGVTCFVDLASPWTYLAAERVEAYLPGVRWEGVLGLDAPVDVRAAEARAAALRLPLVWPESRPGARPATAAMRVLGVASELGRAGRFVLATTRLAFCGGFDVDDPEILAEAIAAAGLPLAPCLDAMGDPARDVPLLEAGRRLAAAEAHRVPVVRVGRTLFDGEARLPEALAAFRASGRPARARRPIGA